jgi:2-oxoglutarate dehydrogenase E1 component
MGMHNMQYYSTGGTIHLFVNNPIGFTTDPRFARSTPYPSDLAKAIDTLIFHINGDNAEVVTFVCQLAADHRAKYKKDIVIDVAILTTNPMNPASPNRGCTAYKAIARQPTPLNQYIKFLVQRGTFTEQDIEEQKKWAP